MRGDHLIDFPSQDDLTMALDDILQPHPGNRLQALAHLLHIAVAHMGKRHDRVAREQDSILLKQDADAIRAVAREVNQAQASLSKL